MRPRGCEPTQLEVSHAEIGRREADVPIFGEGVTFSNTGSAFAPALAAFTNETPHSQDLIDEPSAQGLVVIGVNSFLPPHVDTAVRLLCQLQSPDSPLVPAR